MKDRTMILAGLIFLVIATAVGVTKSLEAGNRMVGTPMAPELKNIYSQNVPEIREYALNLFNARAKTAAAVLEKGIRPWKQKLSKAAEHAREKATEAAEVTQKKAIETVEATQEKVAEVKEKIILEKNKLMK